MIFSSLNLKYFNDPIMATAAFISATKSISNNTNDHSLSSYLILRFNSFDIQS